MANKDVAKVTRTALDKDVFLMNGDTVDIPHQDCLFVSFTCPRTSFFAVSLMTRLFESFQYE